MLWLNILLIILGAYGLICLFFYVFQHYFFFRPEVLPTHFTYKYAFDFEEHHFEMEDGGKINAIHFKVPNSRGVIYYLKGNSRSIKGWGKFAQDFLGNGYDFFMMDYRGFGKSKGKRNETILYNDAQYLYKWLQQHYKEKKIIVYGRSLGSGIAARVASWNKPKLLVLDSPYFSFYYNIRRFGWWMPLRLLLRYRIRTDQFLKVMRSPTHIIHGNKDWLIPIRNSLKLVDIAPDRIDLCLVEGAGHNNLPDYGEYHEFLYDVMNGSYQAHPIPQPA